MVVLAIIALFLGIICGNLVFPEQITNYLSGVSDYILYLLMFCVGISVGMNKMVFQKIKEYHFKIFIIPIGIIIGSIIGGACSVLILDIPLNECIAVASGLGWYSLTGILLSNVGGATLGTIGFLSNLMREIISFMIIPYIAKRFNKFTAIAPAAATSEDTTLYIIMKSTSEEVVIMAIFNGVICSAMVPILIKIFYPMFL